MKLSEAMRAGARLVPQTMGKMFHYEFDEQHVPVRIVAACALGHAYLGIHPEAVEQPVAVGVASQEIDLVWPQLINVTTGWAYTPLGELITGMNDEAGRTTEYIAADLEAAGL